ncbi:MAG: hypothetical protein JST11_16870 [Acidobacteria bacterium]|nr:hypothetical protein [Acidobacteriota bacterium]
MARWMLENKSYESFLPLYKCKRKRPDRYRDVELPIFPGYLFCRFDARARLPVLTTPGVLEIVGAGRLPIPIPESEIDAIRRLFTLALPAEPWPFLEVGQRVYVQDGPLRGVVGILTGVNRKQRLVLAVTLLRRAVAIEVDRAWVLPAVAVNTRAIDLAGRD